MEKPDWHSDKVYTERELDQFENDVGTKKHYRSKFLRIKIIIAFLALFFISSTLFMPSPIAFLVAAVSFIALGVYGFRLSYRMYIVPAICQRCGNTMSRCEYKAEVGEYDNDGTVFICEKCNTKFIEMVPGNSNA